MDLSNISISGGFLNNLSEKAPGVLGALSEFRQATAVGNCGQKPLFNNRGQKTQWEQCVSKAGNVEIEKENTTKRLQNIILISVILLLATVTTIVIIKNKK